MRLAFMGTPDFAAVQLRDLAAWCAEKGHQIVCVYTQPPRAAGRGKQPRPTPVHALADDLGTEVRTPVSLKDPDVQAAFAALDPDVAIVAAYGLILPQPVLDAPRLGCLNVHASLLPRWRGAAPIQRAIMAGDTETGVCIMQMEAGLDTGPVYARRVVPITEGMTAGNLHDVLADGNMPILADAIDAADAGQAPMPQPDEGITYAHKIDKAEARIDWARPAVEVDCQIRGLSPFPGAWFAHDGDRIKVLNSTVANGNGLPGTVLDDALTVACDDGAVRLLRLQKSGKGALETDAFLRGTPLHKGINLA